MYCDDAPIGRASSSSRRLQARILRHGPLEYLLVQQQPYPRPMATLRLVSPDAARRAGGYPLERHFDINSLEPLRAGLVEMAEACIDRGVRAEELARPVGECLAGYLISRGYGHVISTADVELSDGGSRAAGIFLGAMAAEGPEDLRVVPRQPLPLERLAPAPNAVAPPLLHAQLMLGAWVCGDPAKPPGLGSAEIPLLLPLTRLRTPEARRFLARAA